MFYKKSVSLRWSAFCMKKIKKITKGYYKYLHLRYNEKKETGVSGE